MNYEETLEWMFRQIPMYQRVGKAAYKVDLQLTHDLDEYFGHPHRQFKTVHVAGTNGKGSVSHIIASVLQEAGYKTGLYTSPHLKDFRERIRVDGKMVEKEYVTRFIEKHKEFFLEKAPSFFEMTVAMAFDYFRQHAVDVAVVEVGMGGRLDSTNIITPEVACITNIGLDHTQFLGNSIQEIAGEKAGIIKPDVPVVIGETSDLTKDVFRKKAEQEKAPIVFADQEMAMQNKELVNELFNQFDIYKNRNIYLQDAFSDLLGDYQEKNIITALCTLEVLREKEFNIEEKNLRTGLHHVQQNTGFRGRWFVMSQHPRIVCDTAHNREGLHYTLNQLAALRPEKIHFVLGFVNDKNLGFILDMFPEDAAYYFTKADIPRALDEGELANIAAQYKLKGETYPNVHQALKAAKASAGKNDLIYVGGSTFVVSEII